MVLAKRTILGNENAAMIARYLVTASVWFDFEPLPNDYYEFTVKREHKAILFSLDEL